jgi:thioredoxin reductase (NADPH)
MPQSRNPLLEARRDQRFPVLEPAEVGGLWRFGELKSYAADDRIVATGEIAPGAFIILAGRVDVTRRGTPGHSELIVTNGPGSFMGELAQLSGRPSLVDAYAKEAVKALLIPPRRLRDLLVEEAELGERIMRALILRRVALLGFGAGGPVIVGSADHADVLRLENFLARNGHQHQRLDPKTDPCAQTLIERFHIDAHELPIVLCPNGQLLRNPSEVELARCIGLVRPIGPDKIYSARTRSMTSSSSAPARRVLPLRCMQDPRGYRCSCWIAAPLAVKPVRRHALRTIWASRPASAAWP